MTELWEVLTRHLPQFASGLWVTIRVVAFSFVIAMVVGTVVAALRVQPVKWLQRVGGIYVETFRNIPLLVLLIISFAGVRRMGIDINRWVAGCGSLGLYTAAYVAEALRSGVFAVGKGQIDASLSLGFTYWETLRKIVLPQAFRTVIPPLGNLIIAMIKNSAVVGVSLIALNDLLKEARLINSNTNQTNEIFFWAAVGFLLLTVPATFAVRYLERRFVIKR
jgi:His/Glu/Gln/Arg/opine family amino acid ABC transporter permease subunit